MLHFGRVVRWLRAVCRAGGLSLRGLSVVDGYDVALVRVRAGQAVGLREFFAGLLAPEPSTSKPSRALSMGTRRAGKRRHFEGGEVTGGNVEQFVRSWQKLGLIAKAPAARDGGLAAGPGRTA